MMRGLLRSAGRGHHSVIGSRKGLHPVARNFPTFKEFDMTQWTKPQATDLRYGFEITMYISNR